MTAIARRLAVCTLALGTVALAACSGDPVSPTARGARSNDVHLGSTSRVDSLPPAPTATTTTP
jgi:hypothetical protein